MRLESVVSEARRNLASGTSRAGMFAGALAVLAVALGTLDILSVSALQRDAIAFDRAGASTRILLAEQAVDARSCGALRSVAGITAAGALRPRDAVTVKALPANAIPAYVVSPDLAGVLGVRAERSDGVWLPESLAVRLQLTSGETLATQEGPMVIAGTYPYPKDGRDSRLGYAILVPTATSTAFDECWAHIWPANPDVDTLLRGAARVDPADTQTLNVGQLNNNFGAETNPNGLFHDRPTRLVGLGTAMAALALGFVSTRRRRLEYASALHAGQPRSAQVATAVLETVAWTVAGLFVATVALMAIARWSAPTDAFTVASIQLSGPLLATVSTSVGAVVGIMMTSESHLFSYFKDR